ncbi:MAG: hypothetical protein IJG63_08190 [Oscillospiraceae bacterium]|nr:hypothetical protein [Oscillospiraceae bacterium]
MKKLLYVILAVLVLGAMLQGCGANNENADNSNPPEAESGDAAESGVTRDMAYEGVNNYCHSEYDWSQAEDDPSVMYVEMGDETESEYQVIFRSYTGSFVYFYVDKTSGTTRMVDYVPALNEESEAGAFDLFDYLGNEN